MLTDAFLHADSTLKISESTSNPEDFLHMTDSLVAIIERSKEPELKQSRHIIHRLRRRKLYRYVDEHLMPTNRSISISPQDITTCQDTAHSGIILSPEDIHVKMVTLDFGMKEHNPVDKVLFFKNWYVFFFFNSPLFLETFLITLILTFFYLFLQGGCESYVYIE